VKTITIGWMKHTLTNVSMNRNTSGSSSSASEIIRFNASLHLRRNSAADEGVMEGHFDKVYAIWARVVKVAMLVFAKDTALTCSPQAGLSTWTGGLLDATDIFDTPREAEAHAAQPNQSKSGSAINARTGTPPS
jgi:hypothetical protein